MSNTDETDEATGTTGASGPDDLDIGSGSLELIGDKLLDAIDLASDQQRVTWLAAGGKRIAVIGTVGMGMREESLAVSEAAILREAAEIMKRRFGVIITQNERRALTTMALRLEGNAHPLQG